MGYKIKKQYSPKKISKDSQRIQNTISKYQANKNRKIKISRGTCIQDHILYQFHPEDNSKPRSEHICYHWKLFKRLLNKIPGYQMFLLSRLYKTIPNKILTQPKQLNLKKTIVIKKNEKVPYLPGAIWHIIFSFCSLSTLILIEMVSKDFQQLVNPPCNFSHFKLVQDVSEGRPLPLDPEVSDCSIWSPITTPIQLKLSSNCNLYCNSLWRNASKNHIFSCSRIKYDFIDELITRVLRKNVDLINKIIDQFKEASFFTNYCIMCTLPQVKKSYDIIREIVNSKYYMHFTSTDIYHRIWLLESLYDRMIYLLLNEDNLFISNVI